MHYPLAGATYEARARARETKFVADIALRPRLLAWAREHLAPDAHGAGPHGDEYSTSTLYLETPQFDVYHRRGSFGRSKYRIRRYGGASSVFLERKFRTARLLTKRRTLVPLDELHELTVPEPNPEWAGFWFARRVALRRLQPLVQLSYTRVARVGTSLTGPTRMTIDAGLQVVPLADYAFLPGVGRPFLEGACVVEVKYREALPAVFRQLAETFGLEVQKISKFRTALRTLDYPLASEPDEAVPHPLTLEPVDPAGTYAD